MACHTVNLSFSRQLLLLIILALTCWSHPLPSLPVSQASADENLTFASERYPSLSKWASHAYEYLSKFSCHEVLFMTRTNCQRMQARTSESMALYMAEPRERKYKVSRTDGSDFKYAIHDAVLVIDPFPEKKSNHLVMVFFIDLNVDRIHCEFRNGQYLGNGECLTLGLHRGCNNIWNQVSSPRKRVKYAKRCENKHLPIVQIIAADAASSTPSSPASSVKSGESLSSVVTPSTIIIGGGNHLKCSDDVTGFMACSRIQHQAMLPAETSAASAFQSTGYSENRASASLSSSSASSGDDCDPLQTNDSPWKCIRTRSTTDEDE